MRQNHEKEPMTARPPSMPLSGPTPDNSPTMALLEQWAIEDATSDPTAIAQAERELAEFKAALNANRPADSPVFP